MNLSPARSSQHHPCSILPHGRSSSIGSSSINNAAAKDTIKLLLRSATTREMPPLMLSVDGLTWDLNNLSLLCVSDGRRKVGSTIAVSSSLQSSCVNSCSCYRSQELGHALDHCSKCPQKPCHGSRRSIQRSGNNNDDDDDDDDDTPSLAARNLGHRTINTTTNANANSSDIGSRNKVCEKSIFPSTEEIARCVPDIDVESLLLANTQRSSGTYESFHEVIHEHAHITQQRPPAGSQHQSKLHALDSSRQRQPQTKQRDKSAASSSAVRDPSCKNPPSSCSSVQPQDDFYCNNKSNDALPPIHHQLQRHDRSLFSSSMSSSCIFTTNWPVRSNIFDDQHSKVHPRVNGNNKAICDIFDDNDIGTAAADHFSQPNHCSSQVQNNSAIMIQVAPNEYLPLRGAQETWDCILQHAATVVSCLECATRLQCVPDCQVVVCPNCHSMTPLLLSDNISGTMQCHQESAGSQHDYVDGVLSSRRRGQHPKQVGSHTEEQSSFLRSIQSSNIQPMKRRGVGLGHVLQT